MGLGERKKASDLISFKKKKKNLFSHLLHISFFLGVCQFFFFFFFVVLGVGLGRHHCHFKAFGGGVSIYPTITELSFNPRG